MNCQNPAEPEVPSTQSSFLPEGEAGCRAVSTCLTRLHLRPPFPLAEAGGPLTGEGAGSPGFHRSPACAGAPDAVAAGPGTLGNLMAAVPGFSEATSLSTGPERGRDVAEWGGEVLGCLDYSGGHERGGEQLSLLASRLQSRSLGRREWGQLRPRLRRRKIPAEREPGAGLLQGTAGCRGRGGKAGRWQACSVPLRASLHRAPGSVVSSVSLPGPSEWLFIRGKLRHGKAGKCPKQTNLNEAVQPDSSQG